MNRGTKGLFSAKADWRYYFIFAVLGVLVALATYKWAGEQNKLTANNPMKIIPVAFAEELNPVEGKVTAWKEEVLDTLAKCESGGKREEDGIAILDSNNKGSYGTFQWQKSSVQFYYEKMTGQPINGRDAIILALTPDKARTLAEYVIFQTDAGVARDWVNCSRKHNLQMQVDRIKQLTS